MSTDLKKHKFESVAEYKEWCCHKLCQIRSCYEYGRSRGLGDLLDEVSERLDVTEEGVTLFPREKNHDSV